MDRAATRKRARPDRGRLALITLPVLVTVAALLPGSGTVAAPGAAEVAGVTRVTTQPDGALRPSTTSAAEQARLAEKVQAQRERVAAAQPAAPRAGQSGAAAAPKSPQTYREEAESDALLVRRNTLNTQANTVGTTLVEPAAANEGNAVYYTGNTFASSSVDNGVTWNNVALPAGPADAPNACCDQDIVRAHSRDRIFSILLYTNAATTNGAVRIFVRNAPNAATLCSYTIDPGGAANNVLPDYPHIALSANFLYLSLNNITNGAWTGAQVRRFDLTQMSGCVGVSTTIFDHVGSVGQRILTPVEGAQNLTAMYFAAIEATNSLRVFTWLEANAAPTSVVLATATSTFANPDCRGGTGNFDFIERTTSFSAAGFRMRGTVHGANATWFWNAANDATVPQAHVRGATVRRSDSVLLDQPVIWNASFCFGYPALSGNGFGDVGISLAAGGQAGGGGSAAQGFVGNDDTPADTVFFGTVALTASGTHNRTDGRYGDYFTVRTNARCQNTWVATNYALSGGTAVANVNARFIEFGSTLDAGCF
jgi:hypothetical protein